MKIVKQITLNDIAKKLNVSKVTISKALRDHPDISDAMKKKVTALATKLGYTPNFIARNLSAKKTQTIGLVVPKINHHFFSEVIESIYNTAHKKNYEIIMTVSQENTKQEIKHIQSLLAMRVDGLLISITENTKDTDIFKSIKQKEIPLIFFDRVIENLGFNCIMSDDEDGSYQLINYAISQGYRIFGHLGGYRETNIGLSRFNGYKKALDEANISQNPEHNLIGGFSVSDGYNGLMELYNKKTLPEILFTVTYPVALGVYKAAKELNLSIPNDIDVISFGDASYNQFLNPSITGIHQPASEIGKLAVEQLINQIEEKIPVEDNRIIMPVTLNIGQTCIKKEK